MDKQLTLDDFVKTADAFKKLNGYILVESAVLKGMQAVILCGGKAYYSPDMSAGEVKVIEIPEPKIEWPIIEHRGHNAIGPSIMRG